VRGKYLCIAEEMILLTRKRRNRGFLLLEVIVSFTILSIGFTLILSSFMGSIRVMHLSQDYFRAGLCLEEKIYEIYNDTDIRGGSSDGVFSGSGNLFSWKLDVTKLEEDSINEVELKVLWSRRNNERDVSILTYLPLK
jgi:hypothetical protein